MASDSIGIHLIQRIHLGRCLEHTGHDTALTQSLYFKNNPTFLAIYPEDYSGCSSFAPNLLYFLMGQLLRLMCVCQSFSHVQLCSPMDCSPTSSSAHGIPQASILNWIAIFSSRGSSWPRDQFCISCISCLAHRFITTESARKPMPCGTSKKNG